MRADLAIALGLTVLAGAFRLVRIETSPGWDGDEGYNLDIAWQLLHGRAQMFSLSYAFVQHPVLFYAAVAPLLAAFGRELWVLRAFAAVATTLAVPLLYLAVSACGTRRPAVLAGLILAGASFAVAYNRLGYTYNLLLLWSALTLTLAVRWQRTGNVRWLAGAAAAAALGFLTDQTGVSLVLFLAALAWPSRRQVGMVVVVGVLPALAAAALTLALQPEAALTDWRQSFGRAAGGDAPALPAVVLPAVALARWFVNYLHLLRAEWWLPAAVAGLFCIQPPDARRRALLLFGSMALPVFLLRELDPFFRTGIPLLLPLAWGAGALLDRGFTAAYDVAGGVGQHAVSRRRLGAAALVAITVVLPLGLEVGRTAGSLVAGFQMRIDWALIHQYSDARATAVFVNARVRPDDVVITSPHVSWLYDGQVADFLQTLAWQGEAIAFYPASLPRERFRFEPSLDATRFVVVDRYWHAWASEVPPVAALLAAVERWPLAWQSGEFRVFQNPNRG